MRRREGRPDLWHQTTGKNLKEIREQLRLLSADVADAYCKTSAVSRQAQKALKAVGILRHLLEEEYYKDCPGRFNQRVYYGPDTLDTLNS